VPLETPKTGSAKGCTKADVVVIQAIMKDPAGYLRQRPQCRLFRRGRARAALQVEEVHTSPQAILSRSHKSPRNSGALAFSFFTSSLPLPIAGAR